MEITDLLLSPDRQAQLTAALANLGVEAPLAVVLAEAEADVARYTLGYEIAQASLDSWARALALYKAFLAAELGVPTDIAAAYKDALAELTAIAEGKRPNLPLTEAEDEESLPPAAGAYGGDAVIGLRI